MSVHYFLLCSVISGLLTGTTVRAIVIKIDPYNFELYRFKVGAFFETQCSLHFPHSGSGEMLSCV